MIRSISVFLLLVASASVSAQQSAHDYSFLQASYSKVDASSSLDDGDGLGVSLSYGLTPNFHIFGGYLGIDTNSNVDAGGWRAGIGLNTPLSQQLDIVVRLSYQTTERPAPGPGGGSVDDDGLAFGAGVRAAVSNRIELYGGLNYVDLDSGNETVLDAGFLFSLNSAFALGVSTTWDDDVSAWSLDGRLYFE